MTGEEHKFYFAPMVVHNLLNEIDTEDSILSLLGIKW
jgi:hypothetical protein